MKNDNLIVNMTFDFALMIIALSKQLKEQKEFVLSKQLLRSGTSIGANVEEALAGQTKKDFIAKMSIASKEAREIRYWLRLLDQSKLVELSYDKYLKSVEDIIKVHTKIVKTAQSTI
ncbi:MAG TPA: four helix bundle protein [Flavisolibacter sp.]